MQKVNEYENRYDFALKTALQDGSVSLNRNSSQQLEARYQSAKFFNADKELAIDSFFRTLFVNFDIKNDSISQKHLMTYIPAVLVIDYDGYWIYAILEYEKSNGEIVYQHSWRSKKPYAYSDQNGNTINFTLDSYIRAYDSQEREWIAGYQSDLQNISNISLLKDEKSFEEQRRSTIISSIQNDLAYFINKHNEYATRYGISYTFKLPLIDQEEWTNSINDIGMVAFIQGIPIGEKFYNNYAFASGRLIKKKEIYGAIDDATGYKYYFNNSCNFPYRIEEVFSSEKEAAAEGYYPKECINN